ncbi:hypothetical protein ElyMa_001806100 [Elysia marginata]|uniref:Uncharacterized protein n=1 Tax=Elysia marginata TaxID=1093978 RepID=A0AAV4EFN0_9GAST|nr:hypothetical protein ElyMa_001806100 [Elysia marginata]
MKHKSPMIPQFPALTRNEVLPFNFLIRERRWPGLCLELPSPHPSQHAALPGLVLLSVHTEALNQVDFTPVHTSSRRKVVMSGRFVVSFVCLQPRSVIFSPRYGGTP